MVPFTLIDEIYDENKHEITGAKIYVLNSNNVHIFPNAFRGASIDTNQRKSFDPEARVQTERNFSTLIGSTPEDYTSF